jgi:uncharacterized protein YebE (UPF0316 family)
MGIGLDPATLLTGVLIALARIVDVSLGTMRTISIVHGRSRLAFGLGFLEVSVWLFVITTVINQVMTKPILGLFYALGFSLGNVVGIAMEKRLALGHTVLRVITPRDGHRMADRIREAGCGVTTFEGEGMTGPVTELYVVCRRGDLQNIIQTVKTLEPDAFYITEQAGSVSKVYRPPLPQPTGWRSVLKKK